MEIIFEPWREEIIRDNHGCPCRTDYYSTAGVGGVKYSVQYFDTKRCIHIYHGYYPPVNIYGDKDLTTNEIEKIVAEEFAKDGTLKDYWRKAQAEYLKQVGEKLLHERLSYD